MTPTARDGLIRGRAIELVAYLQGRFTEAEARVIGEGFVERVERLAEACGMPTAWRAMPELPPDPELDPHRRPHLGLNVTPTGHTFELTEGEDR